MNERHLPNPSGLPPSLIVSRLDCDRLDALLDALPSAGPDSHRLREELDRADIVEPDQVPPDVITMNSVIRFVDEDSGVEREIALVYPREADGSADRVSILAPVGSALLGLRVGATIAWPLPGGRATRLRVLALTYQPEAAGELHR